MAFLLYECGTTGSAGLSYRLVKKVSLAGKGGPIATYVRNRAGASYPFTWHMCEADLLAHLAGPGGDHALVVDLKPEQRGNVSLYQVKDIWGFSLKDWTPMALRLRTLFVDRPVNSPEEFKRQFDSKECDEPDDVFEFLYLRGGVLEGTWRWGTVGSVNGALLWPDVLKHFVRELGPLL